MATKFMDPHDVPTIPGTEGWERMYPYNYQFSTDDPKRKEHESNSLWYYDGLHYPEPHCPFDLMWDEAWYIALSQNNTRTFLVPPAKGIDHRIVNGYVFITPVPVTDPAEIEKRVPVFMKRAGYYYENWDSLYEHWKVKMLKNLEDLEAISFKDLPEVEDEAVVFENKGFGSGYQLLKKYDELIDMGLLTWQYHFEFLNLCYAAFLTFTNTANSIFPNIPTSTMTKMVSGIDAMIFRPDAELIRLAKLAIENGVDDVMMKPLNADALVKAMEESVAGKHWLSELEKARYPWFYVSTGTGWYHHQGSWNDDLNVPFDSIRMHISAIKAGKQVGRPTEKLMAEREDITGEYRAMIETDEDRQAFDETLAIARRVFPYAEDHIFYVENWFHSVFWNKVREVADILSNAGFIEDREDIWYLKRGEIREALNDYVASWATGVIPRGPSYWPKEIAWRKGVMEKFREWSPPAALGVPPEVVTEPFTIMLWGVTTDVLKQWLKGVESSVSDAQSDELTGAPGSAGIAEGRARVIKRVSELAELQEGEILVATTTSPSWAPAFTRISGAITDVGGSMCHAAIICREYGLPTVVGTGKATSFIKTGDLIRIDGAKGTVKIIERG
jgi:pyruvate,water dikinase